MYSAVRSNMRVLLSLTTAIFLSFVNVPLPIAHALEKATISARIETAGVIGIINPAHLVARKVTDNRRIIAMTPFKVFPKNASVNKDGSTKYPIIESTKIKAGSLLHNFDGVNAIESHAVNGFDLEPPDEGLCTGNGYVINTVNEAVKIYHTDGTVAAGPISQSTFFGEATGTILADPRCYFDKLTNTWFHLIWFNDATNLVSHIDLAVNTSGNPTKTWTIYHIDTTDKMHANCPCFPDYTTFGIDQYNIYLSTNEFGSVTGVFNGAQIYAIAKSQLIAMKQIKYVHFENMSVAGIEAYHVQPAISYGKTDAEYFVASLDPNSTFDNRLAVWAITNQQIVAKGGIPNFTSIVISSETYGFPVDAVTPVGFNEGVSITTTGQIHSDFDALQEVEYINGHLITALDTSITISGKPGIYDGIAWFEITPRLLDGMISSATKVVNQGYLAACGLYLLYPHIEQNWNGMTALVFSFTGPKTYPSAAYSIHTRGIFDTIQIAATGVEADNGLSGTLPYGGISRWGDYSAGQLDPSSNNIWFATQYIPNGGDKYANWGNRIFELKG